MYVESDGNTFEDEAQSDDFLVTAAKEGCHVAYADLFRRHRASVFNVVQRITKNQEDTEDVLQDAWLNAYLHIDKFDGRSRFSTWLTRIAINCALMMLRKRRRFTLLSLDQSADAGDAHIPEPVSLSCGPEDILLQAERTLLVRRAIRRLPVGLREVTELMQQREGSIEEAALNTDISVSAIKSRLRRARGLLRPKLEVLVSNQANQ